MALLVPNVGEERMISLIVNAVATTGQNMKLRLFKSNTTPGSTHVFASTGSTGDYIEATFTGYASIACTSGSWTVTPGRRPAPPRPPRPRSPAPPPRPRRSTATS